MQTSNAPRTELARLKPVFSNHKKLLSGRTASFQEPFWLAGWRWIVAVKFPFCTATQLHCKGQTWKIEQNYTEGWNASKSIPSIHLSIIHPSKKIWYDMFLLKWNLFWDICSLYAHHGWQKTATFEGIWASLEHFSQCKSSNFTWHHTQCKPSKTHCC